MRYDSLIWDFDGTLLDTYPMMTRALQQGLGTLGIHAPYDVLLTQFQLSRAAVMEYCAARWGISAETANRVYRAQAALPANAPPFPHVAEILARFQAGGGRSFVFTHRGDSVHRFLDHHGLRPYFADVVSSGTAFPRKPDPAGNLYLLATHGLNPARTLAIGDRELDILAGKGAGTDACLFTPAPRESAADYQIHEIAQLADIVELPEDVR